MTIHLSLFPQEIIDEYDVIKYVETDEHVYVEITGAIYVLSQSGCIANQDLRKHLEKYEYYPTKRTPGLWKHRTRPISFTLVVDNFGVKYTNKYDIDGPFKAIKKNSTQNRLDRNKYVGINLNWDYEKKEK